MKNRHKHNKKGLGFEWIIVYLHYYFSLKIRLALSEIIIPVIMSLICSFIYGISGKAEKGLDVLSGLLPSIIAILIGFSVMILTILTTNDNNKLNNNMTEIKVQDKVISYHQLILIRSTHVLFNEIILLLVVFVYLYFHGLDWLNTIWNCIFLAIDAYFIINILVSIFNSVVTIYCAYFDKKE